jgi:Fe-Mn family superoxide dismutase
MEANRRDFIKTAGIAAAGVAAVGGIGKIRAEDVKTEPAGVLTEHTLPELPYPYDALEPYIDRETMILHHDIHHKGYVNGLNKAEKELANARATGDFSMIEYWSKKASFNGGGHYLHTLFWENMISANVSATQKKSDMELLLKLKKKISEDFGSFENFRNQFSAAAGAVEGSGWAILHYRHSDGRLVVLQAENQHKLSPWGVSPILVLDVWEHAYYLKYRNKRADYIDAWWNVVNWEVVADRFHVNSKSV